MIEHYQEVRLLQTPVGRVWVVWKNLLLATGEAARRRDLDRSVRRARAERLVVARWGGELKERLILTASGSVRGGGGDRMLAATSSSRRALVIFYCKNKNELAAAEQSLLDFDFHSTAGETD